jgi:hypothetical protein
MNGRVRTPVVRRHGACAIAIACLGVLLADGQASAAPSTPDGPARQRTDSVTLAGTVVDARTREPVAGAAVSLNYPTGRTAAETETDTLGSFRFEPRMPGSYSIAIEHPGYRSTSREIVLNAGVDPVVTLQMEPEAFEVEGVEVTLDRRTSVRLRDFERRRESGFGSFVTRDDIERLRPHRVTEILNAMSPVQVVSDARGNGHIMLRGRCLPRVYIDGVPTNPNQSLDLLVRPNDVEAIEVHTMDTAPPEYANNGCGAIIVWIRAPEPTTRRGSWWPPLALAGALLGAVLFIR